MAFKVSKNNSPTLKITLRFSSFIFLYNSIQLSYLPIFFKHWVYISSPVYMGLTLTIFHLASNSFCSPGLKPITFINLLLPYLDTLLIEAIGDTQHKILNILNLKLDHTLKDF